jgi:hypothetical protein
MENIGVVLRSVVIERRKTNIGRVFSCHRKPFHHQLKDLLVKLSCSTFGLKKKRGKCEAIKIRLEKESR